MGKSRNSARVGGRKDNVMLDRNVQNSLYMHVTVHEQKKREKTKYIFKFESSLSIMLGSCLENEGKNILYLNCQIFPVSLPLLLFSSLSCHSPYKMQTHAKSHLDHLPITETTAYASHLSSGGFPFLGSWYLSG